MQCMFHPGSMPLVVHRLDFDHLLLTWHSVLRTLRVVTGDLFDVLRSLEHASSMSRKAQTSVDAFNPTRLGNWSHSPHCNTADGVLPRGCQGFHDRMLTPQCCGHSSMRPACQPHSYPTTVICRVNSNISTQKLACHEYSAGLFP